MTETMRPMTVADLSQIVADMPRYWGERDMRWGHMFPIVHEFGATCMVADSPEGIRGYLMGWVNPDHVGYIHFIATRDDARGTGLGRRLHEEFARLAAAQGATRLKAITGVVNTNSVAFHTAIGFSAQVVEDYAGPGEARVVFLRDL
ncbi:GCN5-related N-acetyltransferase [Catenulispora acidiphila DSM 44928]|uniref:GCN5-related N-acetyltransferase n=1 Tax=Catenulispora acidiphila (strain DSM 44928 / JCM 14897 / NBRC 102108 / NRRL B-24433 / ID139908) TaxID=479433 RepID=C7Q1P6_CATAD|nr:GNAT family N-acetyltransferase [Catenulispora acidiphila]ACU75597.1 GCN5-related N-acetyltransferase [Catenulispora acidiphila DSM 44928]